MAAFFVGSIACRRNRLATAWIRHETSATTSHVDALACPHGITIMKTPLRPFHPALLVLAICAAVPAAATATGKQDNLLLKRVHAEHAMHLPSRGMTMAQVEKKYGSPVRKMTPRGGGSPHQPVIHRWEYPDYIVYFERNRVIHSVLNTPAGNNTHPRGSR